jgi:transposase-like protein
MPKVVPRYSEQFKA